MRKHVAIAGHSADGLALIPLLEANPEIDVCAVYTPEPDRAHEGLSQLAPDVARRMAERVTDDPAVVLGMSGLGAIVDADLPPAGRSLLHEAPERGIQVTTPLIARLVFAFGPVDAARKQDLLEAP